MRFDYVIADLNALVTPMALHTKAKFMTIATRHCWAVRCCSSSPISAMHSGLWGTPTLAVLHFLDCVSSPLCNFICLGLAFPHCHLAEANFSLSSQLAWHLPWEVFPNLPV